MQKWPKNICFPSSFYWKNNSTLVNNHPNLRLKQLGDLLNSITGFVSRMTRKNERKVPGWERWRRHRLRRGQWSERKRIRKKETIEIRGERKIVSLLCVFVSQMNIMHYLSCVFVLCEWIILYNFVPYWANYYPHM